LWGGVCFYTKQARKVIPCEEGCASILSKIER
jgi:hypothetical protein